MENQEKVMQELTDLMKSNLKEKNLEEINKIVETEI